MFLIPDSLNDDSQARRKTFAQACDRDGVALPGQSAELDTILSTLIFSDFVTKQIVRRPALLSDLLKSGDLNRVYDAGDFTKRLQDICNNLSVAANKENSSGQPLPAQWDKATLMQQLRLFRNREMVRIALRDICGWADVSETLADLSMLADVAISSALAALETQMKALWGCPRDSSGQPVQLVVLGLGKLGAHELNFSSDVDLMFSYAAEGKTSGGQRGDTSNEDYFTRLCRDLIQVIGVNSADGFVFRVDTRLRPFGESGPLVMSFDRLEDYYQAQGREWERYALIKARAVAGDMEAGGRLLKRLEPFVYRRYLDYGAFDSLRDMKGRIAQEVRAKGLEDNIKLGAGGIREIEFFGQMFQLIRGGVTPDLQIRPIREVLAVLAREGFIPMAVKEEMDTAYLYLRTVENRLQQWADQQVHELPKEPEARARLAGAMGYDAWPAFLSRLDAYRKQIHFHFNALLAPAEDVAQADPKAEALDQLGALWRGVLAPEAAELLLQGVGYTAGDEVLKLIVDLKTDRRLQLLSSVGSERLNRLVPLVLKAVGEAENPEQVLARLFDLLRSIQQRASYLALLLENPSILTHLVRLAGASPWIAAFLNKHPVLLDELLDPRTLYRPPGRRQLEEELSRRLSGVDSEDLEYQMEVLRVYKQVNVLRVAASDITHVLPLMKVSDRLSDIAEVVLDKVVQLSFDQLRKKHGVPACQVAQGACERGFVVIAYGKLGGLELGYGSDLDMVFLHAAEPGYTSDPDRPLDNAQFFSRLGQRVLHMLTTHTGAGILYEADMRLRPSGSSGMLVSHIDGFAQYQREDAWTWEHQALIRARAVIGDRDLIAAFEAIRKEILTRPRDGEKLRAEVADMRDRLRKEHSKAQGDRFDIKQGPGGIVDIEFMVQYLVLRHAHDHPEIVRWTDNVRLIQALNEAGILDPTSAFRLRRAYLLFRAMVHRLNLAQRSARVAPDRFGQPRQFVVDTWQQVFSPA